MRACGWRVQLSHDDLRELFEVCPGDDAVGHCDTQRVLSKSDSTAAAWRAYGGHGSLRDAALRDAAGACGGGTAVTYVSTVSTVPAAAEEGAADAGALCASARACACVMTAAAQARPLWRCWRMPSQAALWPTPPRSWPTMRMTAGTARTTRTTSSRTEIRNEAMDLVGVCCSCCSCIVVLWVVVHKILLLQRKFLFTRY